MAAAFDRMLAVQGERPLSLSGSTPVHCCRVDEAAASLRRSQWSGPEVVRAKELRIRNVNKGNVLRGPLQLAALVVGEVLLGRGRRGGGGGSG